MSLVAVPAGMVLEGKVVTVGTGGKAELIEPATGKPWAEVPLAGKTEIDRALEAGRLAFKKSGWSRLSPAPRVEALRKLANLIRENSGRLAEIEARNVGKPIGDARWEINAGAKCFDYYASVITRLVGETIPVSAEGFDFTTYVPVGVVAAIVPWNFPFLIACWKCAPALAAGNAVLLKPASLTPLSALILGELAIEAGIPAGIFQVIPGKGGEVGDYLVSHPTVRKIAFTGDTVTGSRILKLAADDIKRVSLELGGKSPCVVFADADVEQAGKAAPMSVFANTGQDCCARSRMIVERSVYKRFVDSFVSATKELIVGEPLAEATQLGPMVSAGQRQRVLEYISIAKTSGGKLLAGGTAIDRPGFFVEPTIIDGLASDSQVCLEEIFGPVACVIPFDTEEEAIHLANETSYGLSSSLWTKDVERALRVGRQIEAGVLSVNTNSSVHQEAPFGGFKRSGFGRDLGFESLKLYSELKNIFVKVPGI